MLLLSEKYNMTQSMKYIPMGIRFVGGCIVYLMLFVNYKIVTVIYLNY
jgi:hypothetical protein